MGAGEAFVWGMLCMLAGLLILSLGAVALGAALGRVERQDEGREE